MKSSIIAMILTSVTLTSLAQILLKKGMSSAAVQAALAGGMADRVLFAAATSLPVLAGLALFGASVIVWLLVLSKTDVSFAYPFVALGIVITAFAGQVLFHEATTAMRLIGLALVVTGVLTIALAGPSASNF